MDLRKRTLQHGDVVLVAVGKIPTTAKRVKLPKHEYILERGEGIHTHVIMDTAQLEVYEDKGTTYINALGAIEVDHEEHGKATIEAIPQQKVIEREWSYELTEARQTRD